MAYLDIADIVKEYPIGDRLAGVCFTLNTILEEIGMHSFPLSREEIRRFRASLEAIDLVEALPQTLMYLPAARYLPSVSEGQSLRSYLKSNSELLGDSAIPILKAIWENAPDKEIWDATMNSLSPKGLKTPTNPPVVDYSAVDEKIALYSNWMMEYVPDSLEALQSMIRDNESKIARRERFYAKTLVFVQSSGMGKSRLADRYGEICPMITFVLRGAQTSGYPPADTEVREFFNKRLSEDVKHEILATPRKEKMSSQRIPQQKKRSYQTVGLSELATPKKPSECKQEMTTGLPISTEAMQDSLETGDTALLHPVFLDRLATTVWNHSLAVGFLQASFENLHDWVLNQSVTDLKSLANLRHRQMAPCTSRGGRSADRIQFCRSTIDRATEIATSLATNKHFRKAFYDDRDSAARRELQIGKYLNNLKKAASDLTTTLREFQRDDSGEPLLVMAIDEASGLLGPENSSGKLSAGLYYALNRIISCLQKYPIWFFFLSTQTEIRMLIPPEDIERDGNICNDPSARLDVKTSLQCFPPFLALQLDIEDRKRMQNQVFRREELQKSLNEFAAPEHMAMFGRPLWLGFDAQNLNDLTMSKLVGGKDAPYDPRNVHHVFAALSFRFSLDPCLQNPRSLPLTRTAVNSHLRVVISMDQETGVMETITPSEPIMAKAAMDCLLLKQNWSESIKTLTNELLENGLIEKGLKGELYSRWLLILAHDLVRKTCLAPTFTVRQFLTALYAETHHQLVECIPSQLLNAKMNFNHFVPVGENLKPKAIPGLLRDLFRRSAGMQLASGQPTYDILIPVYFGDPEKPFEMPQCGVIMIQVKNREEATTPKSIFGESFIDAQDNSASQENEQKQKSRPLRHTEYFILHDLKYPILFLLFDLGVEAKRVKPVQVSRSIEESPTIWVVHSRGHDERVFGCTAKMECVQNIRQFFYSIQPKKDAHSKLSQRNKVFSKVDEGFRYIMGAGNASAGDVESARVEEGGEDVVMADT